METIFTEQGDEVIILGTASQLQSQLDSLRRERDALSSHVDSLQKKVDAINTAGSLRTFHEGSCNGIIELGRQIIQELRQSIVHALECDYCSAVTSHPYTLVGCGHSFCYGCASAHFQAQDENGEHPFTCAVCAAAVHRKPVVVRSLVALGNRQDIRELEHARGAGDESLFDELFR